MALPPLSLPPPSPPLLLLFLFLLLFLLLSFVLLLLLLSFCGGRPDFFPWLWRSWWGSGVSSPPLLSFPRFLLGPRAPPTRLGPVQCTVGFFTYACFSLNDLFGPRMQGGVWLLEWHGLTVPRPPLAA